MTVKTCFALGLAALLCGCAATTPKGPATPPVAGSQLPPELQQLARLSLETGAYEESRKRFTHFLAVEPDNKYAKLGLAESMLALGDLAGARPLFNDLAADPAYRGWGIQGQALCATADHDFDTALPLLRAALAENDRLWRSWNGLGRIYDARQQWPEAAAAYAKALELAPEAAIVDNNLGYSLLLQGRNAEAIPHFVAALERQPRLDAAQSNLRLALAFEGRYEDAEANAGHDRQSVVLNNVGYVAMARGDYGKAESLLVQAIEKSPNYYDTAWRNLERLKTLRPAPAPESK